MSSSQGRFDSGQFTETFQIQAAGSQGPGLVIKPLSMFSVSLGLMYFLLKQKRATLGAFIKTSSDLKRRACEEGLWGIGIFKFPLLCSEAVPCQQNHPEGAARDHRSPQEPTGASYSLSLTCCRVGHQRIAPQIHLRSSVLWL